MESCSGSHFLGRALREQGHEVRWMPAQYVKPYVQTNKSDFLDAEAIAEEDPATTRQPGQSIHPLLPYAPPRLKNRTGSTIEQTLLFITSDTCGVRCP